MKSCRKFLVVTFAVTWIEIFLLLDGKKLELVVTFAVTWIEIENRMSCICMSPVVTFAVTWIEMLLPLSNAQ